MKWRRKKPSSSFSSSLPSLSRVLPTLWLSTFKRMSIDSEPKPAKPKQNEVRNSVTVRSSKFVRAGERFYSGDGEAFWRLSFEEGCADGKTSKSAFQSAWYDSDHELDFVPSSFRSCGSNATRKKGKEDMQMFSNMACNVTKKKEGRRDTQIFTDIKMYKGEQMTVLATPRSSMIAEKDLKLKKKNERAMEVKGLKRQIKSDEAQQRSAKSVEKNTLEVEPARTVPFTETDILKLAGKYHRKHHYLPIMNPGTFNLRTTEGSGFRAKKLAEIDVLSPNEFSSEEEKWKEMKTEKVRVKSEKQRKSIYMSRELPRRKQNKVRIFSPRTASRVEICKIKALEDMKKAKLKMKTKQQMASTGRIEIENFAIVKRSFDPEKDFRDSMVEMIRENRISQPEELEELLACYLKLNSDAHHDLIIKVFQQLWFDLDQASSDTDLQNEQCYFN